MTSSYQPASVTSYIMTGASSSTSSWHTTARGLLITIPWLLHLVLIDILLSLLLPLSPLLPTAIYNLSSTLAFSVWTWIQHIFTTTNAAHITTSGAALPAHESAIVIANHVSWTDFYMIQSLAQRSGMLGRCRWFAKRELRWVPFLGWGLWAMGMPLVSRRWTSDKVEMERVFSAVVEGRRPICVLLCFFPLST